MTEGLDRVFATIISRKGADPERSYTASLLAGPIDKCARKFAEEAIEAVIAAVARTSRSSCRNLPTYFTIWRYCGQQAASHPTRSMPC